MVFVIYFSGKGYEQIRPRGYVTVGQGEIFFLLCYCTIVLIRTFFTHSAPGNGVYFLSSTAVPLWSNITKVDLCKYYTGGLINACSPSASFEIISPPLSCRKTALLHGAELFSVVMKLSR